MKILLIPVDTKEKEILSDLIQEYQKEILKQENIEEYKYLDSYWRDTTRHPYFIKVDEAIAGFVLVNKYSLAEKEANSISEFYIRKEFRNKGIGKQVAFKTFDQFRGKWEVRELNENVTAQEFWRKVINEYTNGNFKEAVLNNKDWQGPVQIFDNSSVASKTFVI
jgi:predicted acetyltransferase